METNVIYCGDNLEVCRSTSRMIRSTSSTSTRPSTTSRKYEVFWGEAQRSGPSMIASATQ